MDETTARTLLALALSLDRDLGAMLDVVSTIPDPAQRRRFHRAVTDLMGLIARDLVFPLEKIHPAARPRP